MSWSNELMKWNPSEWSNISLLRLSHKTVWIPDIILQENIAEDIASGPNKYKVSQKSEVTLSYD